MPDIFVSKRTKQVPRQTAPAHKSHTRAAHRPQKVTKHRYYHPKDKRKLPGHTGNPLAAYSYYPDKIDFIGTDSEEQVVLLLRRHPITNVKWIIMAVIMLFAPFLLSLFSFFEFLPQGYKIISVAVWYLITTAFILEEFLSWFFNVYIITDERVFDVDFVNLVYREITDANIDQIQDVTVKVGGVPRTIFNYGDILIQTASEIPHVEFEAVPKPDQVAQILRQLRVEEQIEEIEGRVR